MAKETNKKSVGRPQNSVQEQHFTFTAEPKLIESIRDIAYWDRRLYKSVIGEALENYVKAWERKNGPLKKRPPEDRS